MHRVRRGVCAVLSAVLLFSGVGVALAKSDGGNGGGKPGETDSPGKKPDDKPEKPDKPDKPDKGPKPEEPIDNGPFDEIVAFATKTGFRGVVSYSAEERVAGVVHYGTSPDALTSTSVAPGPPDTAQLVFLDGLTVGTTYYFQVEDALTGLRSPVRTLEATNAYNDLGPNTEQDPSEVSYKPNVYTIDLLVQLDAESLPDDVDPDQSIRDIAQGISVMAERIYDALDGHARVGNVIVTDTVIDHGGTLPGALLVHFPGTCDMPRNLADVFVTTAMPFDSHTFHYAIREPCTSIFLGRQGQLVASPWEDDLHFGHVAAHELMHYGFGAPDLYDASGTGAVGGEGCRNLAWDGSLMHNTGGWEGDRWELTEVDESPQLTPCAHNEGYNPSTWDEIQSEYTAVPSRTVIEDMFNTRPRSNPDGSALQIHVLDRNVAGSTLSRFDPSDANPEVTGECAADRDRTTTSFTDPTGDATAVVGTDTGVAPLNDTNLDIVAVDATYVEGDGDAAHVSDADAVRFTVQADDLTELPASGSTGEWFDINFVADGVGYDLVAEWDRTAEPVFRLTTLGATGRVTVAAVTGTWDVASDSITVKLPARIAGATADAAPVFALTPGASLRGFQVVSRRQMGVIVPDADTAEGGCEVLLPGTPPPPPPPPPADGSVSRTQSFTFSGEPGTAVNAFGAAVPVTAPAADRYVLDVTEAGDLTVTVVASNPEVNDIDLNVYDADGELVKSSAVEGGSEVITASVAAGRYTIEIVRFATVQASYSGTASLA